MKFGDSLFQRSVPAWRRYNIDYASIKNFIKVHTTPGSAKARDIPGRGNAFEGDLFDIFLQEHERVSLFVKSKAYEINSRLDSIDRQLSRLQQPRIRARAQQNGIATRRRISKVELEVLKVGEEIQNLARFISSNRLAIRKLLKKYKKWTNSAQLGHMVNDQILKPSDSFCNIDLAPALNRYADYLDAIRAPFANTLSPEAAQEVSSRPSSNGSGKKQDAYDATLKLLQGSSVEFDTALNSPLSKEDSQHAVYWVHPDNILELRVLLLQQLRPLKVSPKNSRKEPTTERERLTQALVGDLDVFVRSHNATPKAAMDRTSLIQSGCAIGTWTWTSRSNALVMFPRKSSINIGFEVARVRKSQLHAFANRNASFPSEDSSDSSEGERGPFGKELAALQASRSRFLQQFDVGPMVHTSCRRSRFSGLGNTTTSGVWASLDEEIAYDELSQSTLQSTSEKLEPRIHFHHAVLTVRGESDGADLISTLDQSHLTERVKGFSILQHAVAVCCKPIGMRDPHWFPTLKKDIRHIPPTPTSLSRSNSSNLGLTGSSKPGSRSTVSVSDGPVTPSEGQILSVNNVDAPKYWNEYDNPEDEDASFVFYVDPNEALFPGQHTMQRWGQQIVGLFSSKSKGKERQTGADNSIPSPQNETSPLLENRFDGQASAGSEARSPVEDNTSSSEDESEPRTMTNTKRRERTQTGERRAAGFYGALAQAITPKAQATVPRDSVASHRPRGTACLICLCLFLSLLSCAVSFYLVCIGMLFGRRPRTDWSSISAVIISLVFAVIGVSEYFGMSLFRCLAYPPQRSNTREDTETGTAQGLEADVVARDYHRVCELNNLLSNVGITMIALFLITCDVIVILMSIGGLG